MVTTFSTACGDSDSTTESGTTAPSTSETTGNGTDTTTAGTSDTQNAGSTETETTETTDATDATGATETTETTDTTDTTDTGDEIPQEYVDACATRTGAYCTKFFECLPDLATYYHGTAANCETDMTPSCVAYYRPGDDNGLDAASLLACATAEDAFWDTCFEFRRWFVDREANADYPTECLPTGARSEGMECEINSQCASGLCSTIARDSPCGVCLDRPAEGEACTAGCQPGNHCTSNSMCTSLAAEGEFCGENKRCTFGLWCDVDSCTPVGAPGDSCQLPLNTTNLQQCSWDAQACNSVTLECTQWEAPGGVGDTCSGNSGPSWNECDDLACLYDNNLGHGFCSPRIQEGEACTQANNIPFRPVFGGE
ncbi:MAG: hypothetical protein ACPG77_09475, partial [Nannocystaceae bacterium]